MHLANANPRPAADVRVWIVALEGSPPESLSAIPSSARVVGPALDGCLCRPAAEAFVEGFNQCMREEGGRFWAVACEIAERGGVDIALM